MGKHYISFLILLLGIVSHTYSQNKTALLPVNIDVSTNADDGVEQDFVYDSKNRIVKIKTSNYSNNSKTINITSYEYNESDEITKKEKISYHSQEDFTANNPEDISISKYVYSTEGSTIIVKEYNKVPYYRLKSKEDSYELILTTWLYMNPSKQIYRTKLIMAEGEVVTTNSIKYDPYPNRSFTQSYSEVDYNDVFSSTGTKDNIAAYDKEKGIFSGVNISQTALFIIDIDIISLTIKNNPLRIETLATKKNKEDEAEAKINININYAYNSKGYPIRSTSNTVMDIGLKMEAEQKTVIEYKEAN